MISIVGGVKDLHQPRIEEKKNSAINYMVKSSGSDMDQLADLLKKATIEPHISLVYFFDQLAESPQQIETGKTRGKVVLQVP